jgi:hypothetical protein
MLKTNLLGSYFQALKRTKTNQNELIIRILHRLPRPVWNFPRIGLDIVSFILRIGAYFETLPKIKKRLNL